MGTWSVALYGSDAASDTRDHLRELLRTPLDERAILDALGASFPGLRNSEDEEYPDLWLAVADQFHRHAVAAPIAFETARSIIDSGLDLAVKRALGMSERDLARRKQLLSELRARWATAHPKPSARKVQSRPDAFIFEAGDFVAYPVRDTGRTINPYFASAEADPDWRHDRYGAMAVLARWHYLGTFATYVYARLSVQTPEKPPLDACLAASIDSQTTPLERQMGEKPQLCVFAGRLTPLQGRKMRFEAVGRGVIHDVRVREELAAFFADGFVPTICLANELSGFGIRQVSSIPISRYVTPLHAPL
jgi:hypothetical protein